MTTDQAYEDQFFTLLEELLTGTETMQQLIDHLRLEGQLAQCMLRLRQVEFEQKQEAWINVQLRQYYQEQYANAWFALRVLLLAAALVAGLAPLYRQGVIPDGWQWLPPTLLLLPFAVAALTGKDLFGRQRLQCGWQWLLLQARPAARRAAYQQLQQHYKALYRARYDDEYYARE